MGPQRFAMAACVTVARNYLGYAVASPRRGFECSPGAPLGVIRVRDAAAAVGSCQADSAQRFSDVVAAITCG